jgi:hypothetical protein
MNQRDIAVEIAYRILEKTSVQETHYPPTSQEAEILAREFLRLAEGCVSKRQQPVSLRWWNK